MPVPHKIPSSNEFNHLSLVAFARAFLRTNPSITSYKCHLLLLDPGLGAVQQAEAYFMLFSTTSDVSWLRATIDLCEGTPGIRRGLEGSEGFRKWKKTLAQLEEKEGGVRVKNEPMVDMEDMGKSKLEFKRLAKKEEQVEIESGYEQVVKVEDIKALKMEDEGDEQKIAIQANVVPNN